MDGLIARYDAVADGDLMLCHARGVAYQRDMRKAIRNGVNAEGENYFDHYAAIDDGAIGRSLHDGRVAFVNKHVGDGRVLDIGVGSGEFIRRRPSTFGRDVNPKAVEWLRTRGLLAEDLTQFKTFTFWDVLEHIDVPVIYFKRMMDGSHLFTSLPIFDDLGQVRASKHYKPNEHLYYWTDQGFIDWMASYRFRLLERSDFETEAGREGIRSFAFVRDLPTYHDTVDQYRKLYQPNYGASAYLYFEQIAKEVLRLNPKSVLDYGCGRSDLAGYFWNDGARRIAKYDPAIPQYETMPKGEFDLVLSTDVMEHIPMGEVDRVLSHIKHVGKHALFTISTIPARAKLPDGRNAHVTLLTPSEWTRWVASVFGKAVRIPTQWEHILMLKTWA